MPETEKFLRQAIALARKDTTLLLAITFHNYASLSANRISGLILLVFNLMSGTKDLEHS